jgi:cation transporter-like permease
MKNVRFDLVRSSGAMFGLAGFAVACVSGLLWEMSATATLSRGLAAIVVCHFVGSIAGSVLEKLVREHNAAYEASKAIPQLLRIANGDAQTTTGGGGGKGRAIGGDGGV